jgi:flavin reductase (DIM6/NTAB) family NADH-FMN oxidoreductase RutF
MNTNTSTAEAGAAAAQEPAQELADRVRAVHRQYPTGVTVVTTAVDGVPYGLAVNAFSSISLDPPLVLVCVNESSRSYPAVFDSDHLGVNILASDQRAVAGAFATSGGDKFAQLDWTRSERGVPVLDGVAGHFELEVKYKIPAFTHTIFIGEVIDARASGKAPLVYQGGGFFDGAQLVPAG